MSDFFDGTGKRSLSHSTCPASATMRVSVVHSRQHTRVDTAARERDVQLGAELSKGGSFDLLNCPAAPSISLTRQPRVKAEHLPRKQRDLHLPQPSQRTPKSNAEKHSSKNNTASTPAPALDSTGTRAQLWVAGRHNLVLPPSSHTTSSSPHKHAQCGLRATRVGARELGRSHEYQDPDKHPRTEAQAGASIKGGTNGLGAARWEGGEKEGGGGTKCKCAN